MSRVAVQVGSAWTRVAAEGRLVAELPSCAVGPALAAVFDGPVDELVLVHPAGVRPPSGAGMPARAVRTAPAALAALARHAAGRAVVVDVGHGGAEIADVRAGQVGAVRRLAVGGARLDAATAAVLAAAGATAVPAEARRVREALSLLPEVRAGTPSVVVRADDLRAALSAPLAVVVDAVRAVVAAAGPGRSPPVLLIGGVSRTPLLAELLDAACVGDVQVAAQPDTAAVTGALLLPEDPAVAEPGRRGAAVAAAPAGPWLPPLRPVPYRRSRSVLGALAAAAGTAGLVAAGAVLPPSTGGVPPSTAALPSTAPPPTTAAAGDLVQYGYAVRLPEGWAHTGGLPGRRRSLITPTTAPDGTDLISVERTPLGYDADAEPRRARAELHAEFAAAVEGGAPLSGFDDGARYAGRPVVTYREAGGGSADSGAAGDVDWYVVLDGDAQLSVGCRHTPAGAAPVAAACATVVGSLRRTS